MPRDVVDAHPMELVAADAPTQRSPGNEATPASTAPPAVFRACRAREAREGARDEFSYCIPNDAERVHPADGRGGEPEYSRYFVNVVLGGDLVAGLKRRIVPFPRNRLLPR